MKAHQLINQTSGAVEYYTPAPIVSAARLTMGTIELDPASSAKANEIVGARRFFTQAEDGLTRNWFGEVWLNHPFQKGRNHLWINKAVASYEHGSVTQCCLITYACTSEKWFQPLLAYPQCFLCPRTDYLLPDGSVKKGVTKGSCVTYLGPNLEAFASHFAKLGTVKVAYPTKPPPSPATLTQLRESGVQS